MSNPVPDFSTAALPVPANVAAAMQRNHKRVSAPGATLTGAQRVHAAEAARQPAPPANKNDVHGHIAWRIMHDARSINQNWVEAVTATQVSEANYVELCGLVSQLSAVDTFGFGLDMTPAPFYSPDAGAPTGEIDETAKKTKTFVPVAGPAGALTALSLLPSETKARGDLHGPIYLTSEQMQHADHADVLTRAQIELIAARTSWLNHCEY